MDISELQAAVSRAQEAAGAIIRDLDGASDAQRAELEAQLRQANDETERALNDLVDGMSRAEQARLVRSAEVEPNGFSAGEPEPVREDTERQQHEDDAAKKVQIGAKEVRIERSTYYAGSRFTLAGMAGIHNRVREVHTDPVVLEIARHKAISEHFDKQKAIAQEAAKEAAKAERKELDRAAFEYEGLPQNRGITRDRYIAAEKEWKEHLDAHPERRAALAEQQRDDYMRQRSITSGVPHREAQPGEKVEGKVVGVKSFEGVKHTVIETKEPPPQRVVVAGEVKGVQLGKEVQVTTDADRRVHESRAVAARDERNTGRSR